MDEKKIGAGQFAAGRKMDVRAMAYENETKIIHWIYRWGFSTKQILTSIQGLTRSSTLRTIEKQGKILREPTHFASPAFVYKLSELGAMIAEARLDESIEYPEVHKEKVVTSHFLHDLYVQALTLTAGLSGVCDDYGTPRTILGGGQHEDRKIPDAIWMRRNGGVISLEVEINQKWDKRLDNFFGRIIESIESGEIFECLIVTTSRATARNYTKALSVKSIPVWVKKSGGIWRFDRDVELRPLVAKRIHIIHTPESEMHRTIKSLTTEGDLKLWLAERTAIKQDELE